MHVPAKTELQGSEQDIPVTLVSCEIEKAKLSGPELQSNEFSKHFLFWEGTVEVVWC